MRSRSVQATQHSFIAACLTMLLLACRTSWPLAMAALPPPTLGCVRCQSFLTPLLTLALAVPVLYPETRRRIRRRGPGRHHLRTSAPSRSHRHQGTRAAWAVSTASCRTYSQTLRNSRLRLLQLVSAAERVALQRLVASALSLACTLRLAVRCSSTLLILLPMTAPATRKRSVRGKTASLRLAQTSKTCTGQTARMQYI